MFYYVKSEDIPFKRFAYNKIRASLLCGCGCRFNICSGDIMSYYDETPEKISKYIDEISKKADEWVEDYINNKVSKLTEYDIIKLVNDGKEIVEIVSLANNVEFRIECGILNPRPYGYVDRWANSRACRVGFS